MDARDIPAVMAARGVSLARGVQGVGGAWCEGRRVQVTAVTALRILQVTGGQSDNGVIGSNHINCIHV